MVAGVIGLKNKKNIKYEEPTDEQKKEMEEGIKLMGEKFKNLPNVREMTDKEIEERDKKYREKFIERMKQTPDEEKLDYINAGLDLVWKEGVEEINKLLEAGNINEACYIVHEAVQAYVA